MIGMTGPHGRNAKALRVKSPTKVSGSRAPSAVAMTKLAQASPLMLLACANRRPAVAVPRAMARSLREEDPGRAGQDGIDQVVGDPDAGHGPDAHLEDREGKKPPQRALS